jgi:hypothetical protein
MCIVEKSGFGSVYLGYLNILKTRNISTNELHQCILNLVRPLLTHLMWYINSSQSTNIKLYHHHQQQLTTTRYKPFQACCFFMGVGLSVFSLVDLRLFCQFECVHTLNWKCVDWSFLHSAEPHASIIHNISIKIAYI